MYIPGEPIVLILMLIIGRIFDPEGLHKDKELKEFNGTMEWK